VLWSDPLPRKQESHVISGTHRFDLGAQAVERVPVDPGEQPPVAPLECGSAGGKPAPEYHSFAFQRRDSHVGIRLRDLERGREFPGCGRPDDSQTAAEQLANRILAADDRVPALLLPSLSTYRSIHLGQSFGCGPDGVAFFHLEAIRPPGLD
jgi:hypothetical protein